MATPATRPAPRPSRCSTRLKAPASWKSPDRPPPCPAPRPAPSALVPGRPRPGVGHPDRQGPDRARLHVRPPGRDRGTRRPPRRRGPPRILDLLDQLIAGKLPPEIHLDLIEAPAVGPSRRSPRSSCADQESKPKDDPLAPYREALAGGDPDAARAASPQGWRGRLPPLPQGPHVLRRDPRRRGRPGPHRASPQTTTGTTSWNRSSPPTRRSPRASNRSSSPPPMARSSPASCARGRPGRPPDHRRGQDYIDVPKTDIEERRRGPSAMPADLATQALPDRIPRPHRLPRHPPHAPESVISRKIWKKIEKFFPLRPPGFTPKKRPISRGGALKKSGKWRHSVYRGDRQKTWGFGDSTRRIACVIALLGFRDAAASDRGGVVQGGLWR